LCRLAARPKSVTHRTDKARDRDTARECLPFLAAELLSVVRADLRSAAFLTLALASVVLTEVCPATISAPVERGAQKLRRRHAEARSEGTFQDEAVGALSGHQHSQEQRLGSPSLNLVVAAELAAATLLTAVLAPVVNTQRRSAALGTLAAALAVHAQRCPQALPAAGAEVAVLAALARAPYTALALVEGHSQLLVNDLARKRLLRGVLREADNTRDWIGCWRSWNSDNRRRGLRHCTINDYWVHF
jgi:hypothetical protein